MNEEQKVTTSKAKLPTKTKIAVWWLVVFGIIVLIIAVTLYFPLDMGDWHPYLLNHTHVLPMVIFGFFYMIPSLFQIIKEKWAWTVAVILLTLALIYPFGYYIRIPFLLIPLVLIIVDRKNYFEMLCQRELEKK